VLALLDRATEWLVANGRTEQWGTQPHSTDPRPVTQITAFAEANGLWIAEADGQPALWDDCVKQATADGESMSAFVTEAIRRELARRQRRDARQ
jgi:hypothetical protein